MTWIDYWNETATVYVGDRHKQVHYATVARDLIAVLPPDAHVVDYGCGEALFAARVADACAHLYLCDSANSVRERLSERYSARRDISVIAPAQFELLADGSVDLIVINSVIQYLSLLELQRLLAIARSKLRASGSLLLADVIPPNTGAASDATALLRFAKANGFLLSAGVGLVRLLFSKYRHTRGKHGLLRFGERDIIHLLERSGFQARRHFPNLGHNQKRMALMATSSHGARPIMRGPGTTPSPHRPRAASGSTSAA